MRRLLSTRRTLLGQADNRSQFFYINAVYDQAYKSISSALRSQQGLILLVGEAGTGKTKLLQLISSTLEEQIRFCTCASPPSTLWELLTQFDDLLAPSDRKSEPSLKLDAIADRLRMWAYRKGTTALVIDDAHMLSNTVLDQLSFLLDLGPTCGSLLQIVLVGRPALEDKLATPELRHIQARIAVRSQLTPLSAEEVRSFVYQRYRNPRGLRQYLFTVEAIDRIAHHSQAIPGRINTLSEGALIAAYAQGQKVVTPEIVDEMAAKLDSSPPREFVPKPQNPIPLPVIERKDGFLRAVQGAETLHLHRRMMRFGRTLVAVGLCAIILLACLIIGKQISRERLTTALPLMIQRTKKFLPRLIVADSISDRQGHYQKPLPPEATRP